MRNRRTALAVALAVTALMGSGVWLAAQAAGDGSGDEDATLLNAAKVPLGQAVRAAEDHAKGKAVQAKLEDENGAIVWEVEVVGADRTTEVKVDSRTGKVLRADTDLRDDDRNAEADRHEGERAGDTDRED